jgi:pyruvate dehydrogenase E1 component beta subunit
MSIDITMPALSPTMEEGTLAKWNIKVGDRVKSGMVIAEIETDKATMEVEAVDEGEVLELLVPAGSQGVKVNTVIARLAGEGGVPAPKPVASASPALVAAPVATSAASAPTAAPVAAVEAAYADRKLVPTAIRDALRDAIAEEMRRDPTVFLMGEEVGQYQGAYKVSRDLLQEFGPDRIVDTPITEHGFAGLGVGAAFGGLKPIVEFMTWNFAMQAIDHIINSAAKTLYMSGGQMGCSIVFRGPNGAAARVGAQHSQDYSAWYAHVPGLKVVAPYDAADAKGLLKAAIRDPNPVVFLEHELLYGDVSGVPEGDDVVVPIGKARVRRTGKDVTLVAHSRMVKFALEAAEILAKDGIEAEVVDLRSLRPLDTDTVIASVKKTHRLVCCEEGWRVAGIGAEVAATVTEAAFDWLDAPPARVHQKDVPLPYAANLEKLSLPGTDDIVKAAKAVCYKG